MSPKRMQSLLPSQAPELLLNNSQKKELPACMYARQLKAKLSSVNTNNTSVKAIFIPRRKRSITEVGLEMEEKQNSMKLYFLLLTGH